MNTNNHNKLYDIYIKQGGNSKLELIGHPIEHYTEDVVLKAIHGEQFSFHKVGVFTDSTFQELRTIFNESHDIKKLSIFDIKRTLIIRGGYISAKEQLLSAFNEN